MATEASTGADKAQRQPKRKQACRFYGTKNGKSHVTLSSNRTKVAQGGLQKSWQFSVSAIPTPLQLLQSPPKV